MTSLSRVLRLSLGAAVLLLAGGAEAADGRPCAPHAQMAAFLADQFREAVIWQGIAGNGALLEIFAGPDPSFTLTMTMPHAPTCIMASRKDWGSVVPPAPGGRDS